MPQEVESVLWDLLLDGQGKMGARVGNTLATLLNMGTLPEH